MIGKPIYNINSNYLDKIKWRSLQHNSSALYILLKYDKYDWNDFHAHSNINEYSFYNFNYYDVDFEIDLNKIDLDQLSKYPNAIPIFEKYLDKFSKLDKWKWSFITQNEHCIHLIKNHLDKLDTYAWYYLTKYKHSLHLIENNIDKLDDKCWGGLACNPNAIHIIDKYLYKLNKTAWSLLSSNPNAISILEKKVNLNKIDWKKLSSNPNAIHILEENLDKVHWQSLSKNPNAIHILEQNLNQLDNECWTNIMFNPNAKTLLQKYAKEYLKKEHFKHNLLEIPNAVVIIQTCQDKIDWEYIYRLQIDYINYYTINNIKMNRSDAVKWTLISKLELDDAMSLIEQNLDKANWEILSSNKKAIHILEKNIDKIDWWNLSYNPNAIRILENHLDKIIWSNITINKNSLNILEHNISNINLKASRFLRQNKNAVILLKKYPYLVDFLDDYDWYELSYNPYLCDLLYDKYNYKKMKEQMKDFCEELVQKVFHPLRLQRICNLYNLDLTDYLDLL